MSIEARLTRLERNRRAVETDTSDVERFAWYGESCPHGLPPGECPEHPTGADRTRGRRLATGGPGTSRPDVGRARAEVARSGFAGSSRRDKPRKIALVGPTSRRRPRHDGPRRFAPSLSAVVHADLSAEHASRHLAQWCPGDDVQLARAG